MILIKNLIDTQQLIKDSSGNDYLISLLVNSETPFFSVVNKIGIGQFYIVNIFYLVRIGLLYICKLCHKDNTFLILPNQI